MSASFSCEYRRILPKSLVFSETKRNFAGKIITPMTKTRRNQIIEEIRQTARRVSPAANRILLFGSQARGDARKDSDWDILILLDKERIRLEDIDNVSYPLRELGWELGENINTILYTVNDWERDSFTPFHKNVESEAIPL